MRALALDEHARNHAHHAPAGREHGVGDDAHEPELAATVNQREAGVRQRRCPFPRQRASS